MDNRISIMVAAVIAICANPAYAQIKLKTKKAAAEMFHQNDGGTYNCVTIQNPYAPQGAESITCSKVSSDNDKTPREKAK